MKTKTKLKAVSPFVLMDELRNLGWCVVIKCLPKELGWLIQGRRSEYDGPFLDTCVGYGKWLCDAQWMRLDEEWQHDEYALADTPEEAIRKVYLKIIHATKS